MLQNEEYINKEDLLEILKISPVTLWRHIREGIIPPAITFGRKVQVFSKSELNEVFNARKGGAYDPQIKKLVSDIVKRRAKKKEEFF